MATPAPRLQPEAPPELRAENAPDSSQSSAPGLRRPTPDDIAREAYLIYQANGCQDGREQDDWYEAEARLCGPPRQTASPSQQAAAQLEAVDTRDRTPG